MVRTVGLEPTRVTPLASKTSMSTNFITSACSLGSGGRLF